MFKSVQISDLSTDVEIISLDIELNDENYTNILISNIINWVDNIYI